MAIYCRNCDVTLWHCCYVAVTLWKLYYHSGHILQKNCDVTLWDCCYIAVILWKLYYHSGHILQKLWCHTVALLLYCSHIVKIVLSQWTHIAQTVLSHWHCCYIAVTCENVTIKKATNCRYYAVPRYLRVLQTLGSSTSFYKINIFSDFQFTFLLKGSAVSPWGEFFLFRVNSFSERKWNIFWSSFQWKYIYSF